MRPARISSQPDRERACRLRSRRGRIGQHRGLPPRRLLAPPPRRIRSTAGRARKEPGRNRVQHRRQAPRGHRACHHGSDNESRRDEARQIPVRRGTAALRHARLKGPSGAFARIERDRDREMARYHRDRREVALGERTSRDAIRTLGWVARPSGFGFVREDTASAGSPATPCLRQVRQSGTTRMTSRTPHAKDVKRSASAYPLYAGGHRGRDRRQMASNLVEKIAAVLGISERPGRGAATLLARGGAGPEGRHQDGPMRLREGAP